MKPGPFFLKKKKSGVPKKGPGDLSYVLRPQSAVPKKGPGSYVRSPQSYVRSPQSGVRRIYPEDYPYGSRTIH